MSVLRFRRCEVLTLSAEKQNRPIRWRRWLRLAFVVFVLLALVIVLSAERWMPYLYRWLDVTGPPVQADALIILGGGAARAERAAEIYSLVKPDFVILSGSVDGIALKSQILEAAGIPQNVVYTVAADTFGTYDEAVQILELLQQAGAASALIVTDGFHSRRAMATYRCLTRSSQQQIVLHITGSIPDDRFERWWESKHSCDTVLIEWVKLMYYTARYGVVCY